LRSPRERLQVIDRFWGVDDRESHDQPDADLDRASMPGAGYAANSAVAITWRVPGEVKGLSLVVGTSDAFGGQSAGMAPAA
jgi:hypothetical protein